MRGPLSKITIWALLLLSLAGITSVIISQTNTSMDAALVTRMSDGDSQASSQLEMLEGYRRADGPIDLQLPRDHGPHPEFQTEWWYYTGNLETVDGRHFGYQLTFFRRALIPANAMPTRESNWATNQIYMAHFAVTDAEDGKFADFERFSRGSVGLAGAQSVPYQVWLHDWHVREEVEGIYHLQAAQEDLFINLKLTDLKGPILHGIHGYSQKGQEAGNASYYISQTRLQTSGKVKISGQEYAVIGTSWMDHEFSTRALTSDQVGWDWFSIQLNLGAKKESERDHIELMVYQIRKADGTIDPFSSGTLIYPDGSTSTLNRGDFRINPTGTWHSPSTGGIYPSGWLINLPSEKLQLEIEPYLEDQELNVSFDYWEGAVKISGSWDGQPVEGAGYVELTGYAEPMRGDF